MGEVDHKYRGLGSFWPKQNIKTPSQRRVSASKVLRKKFKNLQKTPKNLQNILQQLPEQPIYGAWKVRRDRKKEGTPHGGALLIQTTELQAVAR